MSHRVKENHKCMILFLRLLHPELPHSKKSQMHDVSETRRRSSGKTTTKVSTILLVGKSTQEEIKDRYVCIDI